MKVNIVKEVMACDVSPMAMLFYLISQMMKFTQPFAAKKFLQEK